MKLFLLLIPYILFADLEKDFLNLSSSQFITLEQANIKGKSYNLQWSLSAIAWKESDAGRYNINLSDPSCGAYHANINSVMRRHPEYPDTSFYRNIVCQRLIDDIDYATSEAVKEIHYWMNIHGTDWYAIWASYNAGYAYNSKVGKRYAKDIARRIQVLKKHF